MLKYVCVRNEARKRSKDRMDCVQSSEKVVLEAGSLLRKGNKHQSFINGRHQGLRGQLSS